MEPGWPPWLALLNSRWRWALGPDGEPVRQSNARFVRWSDGSLQLWLGDEVLDAREIDIGADHNYAYVRHQQLIQVCAGLGDV